MFDNFPYSDMHQLNLDWIIKIAKDFLDQYTQIQETITQGLEDLDTKAQQLEQLLQAWYDTHSQDIANQLADALQDLNEWYTEHQGYLDQYVQTSITDFQLAAQQKAAETLETIPADYTSLSNTVTEIDNAIFNSMGVIIDPFEIGGINATTGANADANNRIRPVGYLPNDCTFIINNSIKILSVYYDASHNRVAAGSWQTKNAGDTYTPYNANATYVRVMIAYTDDSVINNVQAVTSRYYIDIPQGGIDNFFQFRGNMETLGFTEFKSCVQTGYYRFNVSYLSSITDKPYNLTTGGIVIVFPRSGNDVVFRLIMNQYGDQWINFANNAFTNKRNMYKGDMAELGLTTFAAARSEGYFNFSLSYLPSITDKPTNLQYGGIVESFPNSAGGVVFQIVTDAVGNQWFRFESNDFVQISYAGGTITRNVVWYALGDSITQGFTGSEGEIGPVTSNNYVTNLARLNGYTFVNYGVGGAGYLHHGTVLDQTNAREKVNLIDFSECDLVTLAYGVNDWHYQESIGTYTDSKESGTTMCSNMKYVIEKILTDNPMCKIIVLTPLNCSKYGGTFESNWGLGYSLPTSGTLQQVTDAIISVCNYYGIEYVDQSKTSIINRFNINNCLGDGIHPLAEFYPEMAKDLASKVNMK